MKSGFVYIIVKFLFLFFRGGGIREDVGSHRRSLDKLVQEQFADPQVTSIQTV